MPHSRRLSLIALSVIVSVSLAPAAMATETEPSEEEETSEEIDLVESTDEIPDYTGIEDIVVTAERRSSQLQKTPVAVSAFTGADLAAAGIENVQDLSVLVPNFHFGKELSGARVTIRGVSQAVGDPATALHLDGVYQNNPLIASDIAFFDIGQIEVLRGPQGTLYGRNATGGSINISSRRPTHDVDAYGDVMVGAFDQIFSRAVLNVPVVQDRIATRFAVYQNRYDGYQRNLFTPLRSQDADDARNWGLRAQTLFEPNEDLRMIVRGRYDRVGGVGLATKRLGPLPATVTLPNLPPLPVFAGASPNPENPREIYKDSPGSTDVSQWSLSGELGWDLYELPFFGDARLKVIGSYMSGERMQVNDADLTDLPILRADTTSASREWVAEANFASADGGNVDWLIGIFYLGARTDLDVDVPGLLVGTLQTNVDRSTVQAANSAAVYGQGTYRFLDERLGLTLGLRYTRDWKTGSIFDAQVNVGPFCALPELQEDRDGSWNAVTGVGRVDFNWTDERFLYASISRGYKAGALNFDVPDTCGPPPTVIAVGNARPESIWAYEIGSKNRFFSDHVQLNLTAFYYDYNDLQVSQLVDASIVTQNAEEARIFGAEVEVVWVPIDRLKLTLDFGYLNARYVEFMGLGFSPLDPSQIVDFSGNTMVRAPELSGTVSAEYEFDLDRYGSLTPRAQVYASSRVFFIPSNARVGTQPGYALIDLRLTWRSNDEQLYIEGFANNVTGVDVANTLSIGSALLGRPTIASYDPPMLWGVRLGLSY